MSHFYELDCIWHRWFAWYPVPVYSGPFMRDGFRWFRYVKRHWTGREWEYKV